MTPEMIEQAIMSILSEVKGISPRLEAIEASLKRDYHVIHGNGKPGILDRLQDLEKWREAHGSIWRTLREILTILVSLAALAVAVFHRAA